MPDALTISPLSRSAETAPARPGASLQVAALRAGLSFVKAVVDRRNTIPVLSTVLVRGVPAAGHAAAYLELTGTNLDTQLRRTVPATVTRAFTATLDPWLLERLLAPLPRLADINLILADPETWEITCPAVSMNAKATTLPPEDFPLLDRDIRMEQGAMVDIDAQAMAGALARCAPCISMEVTRYYLNGVYLHRPAGGAPDRLTTVATDGHRLMVSGFQCAANFPGMIVPHRAVTLIRMMLMGEQTVRAAAPLSRNAVPALVLRTAAGAEIITKTINGTFPNYEKVMPKDFSASVELPVPELVRALRLAVAPIRDRKTLSVILHGAEPGRITVRTAGSSAAEGSVTAHFNVPGYGAPPMPETGFNARYLFDLIDSFGTDTLIWHHKAAGEPNGFTAPGCTDRAALMPMRI